MPTERATRQCLQPASAGVPADRDERENARSHDGSSVVGDGGVLSGQRRGAFNEEFLFNDRGDTELRGFEDPVRVYEVRWREEA